MIHNSTVVHFSQKQQHFCLHPSSVFCLVARQPSNFFNAELASPFGKMPILTKRFGANTFQTSLHGCRANFSDWLLPLAFLFLDTLLPRVFEDCGSEGGSAFRVGFARYLLSCQNHRRRIPRYPHGLQLGRVKFFLANNMHTSQNPLQSLSFVRLLFFM